jgi:WD40 repeat protein
MGLIAHPSTVSDIAVSCDGEYLLTAGGDDMTINMWHINTSVVAAAVDYGGTGLAPFAGLLEGGLEGDVTLHPTPYTLHPTPYTRTSEP